MKSIARTTLLAGLFASLVTALAACSGGASPSESTAAPAPAPAVQVVDADQINALPAGEKLTVDVTKSDATALFDTSKGPIDYTRISFVQAEGHAENLDGWLSEYAKNTGSDVREASDFEMSAEGIVRASGTLVHPPCAPSNGGACCAIYIPGTCYCRVFRFC